MNDLSWHKAAARTTALTYAPSSVLFTHGEGAWLVDQEGRRYLDFHAGIAVSCLGHGHPGLVSAIQEQAAKLLHVSNAFFNEPQMALQQELVERSFAERVFFCNSGAEANEAALKLARRYQRVVRGADRWRFIVFERSFHGRTMGALSATAQPKYHEGFEPMVDGFDVAPFGDLEAVERLIGPQTAGILVEPVQGEGGIRPAPEGFLKGLRTLCDAHGMLLLFDEVQTGVGRTGEWFAHDVYGVRPDIMALAKGIGGGVPLGAMLATEEVSQGFQRGSHATTYGGNPLATAAGLAVFRAIQDEGLLERVGRTSRRFSEGLRHLGAPEIEDVRGLGWMVGAVLDRDAAWAGKVVQAGLQEGLVFNTAGGNVLRFVPPLIVTDDHVDEALQRLARALARVRQAEG